MNWIKVGSPDELKAGMTVKVAGCAMCGSNHVLVLSRRDVKRHVHVMDMRPGTCPVRCRGDWWHAVGLQLGPGHPKGDGFCTVRCVADGRLFRLDTGDLSEPSEQHRQPQLDLVPS